MVICKTKGEQMDYNYEGIEEWIDEMIIEAEMHDNALAEWYAQDQEVDLDVMFDWYQAQGLV